MSVLIFTITTYFIFLLLNAASFNGISLRVNTELHAVKLAGLNFMLSRNFLDFFSNNE